MSECWGLTSTVRGDGTLVYNLIQKTEGEVRTCDSCFVKQLVNHNTMVTPKEIQNVLLVFDGSEGCVQSST